MRFDLASSVTAVAVGIGEAHDQAAGEALLEEREEAWVDRARDLGELRSRVADDDPLQEGLEFRCALGGEGGFEFRQRALGSLSKRNRRRRP